MTIERVKAKGQEARKKHQREESDFMGSNVNIRAELPTSSALDRNMKMLRRYFKSLKI